MSDERLDVFLSFVIPPPHEQVQTSEERREPAQRVHFAPVFQGSALNTKGIFPIFHLPSVSQTSCINLVFDLIETGTGKRFSSSLSFGRNI